MKAFSEYDKASGVFTSSVVRGMVPRETQTTAWLAGQFDHTKQRVDIATGEVVEYVPVVSDRKRQRRRTMARIEDLERRQLRPLRELQIDRDNAEAAQRLASIDEEIANLRKVINDADKA